MTEVERSTSQLVDLTRHSRQGLKRGRATTGRSNRRIESSRVRVATTVVFDIEASRTDPRERSFTIAGVGFLWNLLSGPRVSDCSLSDRLTDRLEVERESRRATRGRDGRTTTTTTTTRESRRGQGAGRRRRGR